MSVTVVRRSESADAVGIQRLLSAAAESLFGRINVLQLLEKANLAVSVADSSEQILGHASFLDRPAADVDLNLNRRETFLQDPFTSANTLFLHLFVARPDVAAETLTQILRAVFDAVPDLDHVLLIRPDHLELATPLREEFEPVPPGWNHTGPPCSVFVCPRRRHCPRLHVRPARLEDHDDVMALFDQQRKLRSVFGKPESLTGLLESQDQGNHVAVCEVEGLVVGFVGITADVELSELRENFDLDDLDGLQKKRPKKKIGEGSDEPGPSHTTTSAQEGTRSTEAGSVEEPNAFWIQFFVIDSKYETRSKDVLPYVFSRFPDLDFCVLTAPTLRPDFTLMHSFFRAPPRSNSSLLYELYLLHRAGLRPVQVRTATPADRPSVSDLVQNLPQGEVLLRDLDRFYRDHADPDGVRLQAFVAQVDSLVDSQVDPREDSVVDSRVVGVVMIRDEQEVDMLLVRYSVESFIYASHHGGEEHGAFLHLFLAPGFQHWSRQVLNKTLTLARRSCLYARIYMQSQQLLPLDLLLDSCVPVPPRAQLLYPLQELGLNAPSSRVTEEQAPFALYLLSRKLTLEPKVSISARVVVVGASDTALSFLQELSLCPHLRFTNLTLISRRGFPEHFARHDADFLSTSHAYSGGALALLPVSCSIAVVTGKMVGVDRKSKRVLVGGARWVPYDFLLLTTGLQYQMPRPVGQQTPPTQRRRTGPAPPCPAPSNLFILNDARDCDAVRRWLLHNFVEQDDQALVYGEGLDVYTTVQTLLDLGVRGSRIHLLLPPPGGHAPCFTDPAVERAVGEQLQRAGVRVHGNCILQLMNHGLNSDLLTSMTFSREDEEDLHLQCGVCIYLGSRGIDGDIIRSIMASFLLMDGRLIIDADFRTNDSAIFAAGPLTAYSRRYHDDRLSHAHCNSHEVGRHLASVLLGLLDRTQQPTERAATHSLDPTERAATHSLDPTERAATHSLDPTERAATHSLDPTERAATHSLDPTHKLLLPVYTQAKIQGGQLPGGYHYLHLTRPSSAGHHMTMTPPPQVRRVGWGRVESGSYTCLKLDSDGWVESVSCCSLKPLPLHNYLRLYGKHEQLLGGLLRAGQEGAGEEGGAEPLHLDSSSSAVLLDRFSDLEAELLELTARPTLADAEALAVRQRALNYLSYNRNLLPMFYCHAHP